MSDFEIHRDTEALLLLDGDETEPEPLTPADSGVPVREQRRIVLVMCLLVLCFATVATISAAPEMRILEDNICRQYYRDAQQNDAPIDEDLCKQDEIQSKLAYLVGYLTTFEAVIGLAVAFPYGIMADKFVSSLPRRAISEMF